MTVLRLKRLCQFLHSYPGTGLPRIAEGIRWLFGRGVVRVVEPTGLRAGNHRTPGWLDARCGAAGSVLQCVGQAP